MSLEDVTCKCGHAYMFCTCKKQEMSPERFALLMQQELTSNAGHKGDWTTWKPTAKEALGELGYHVAKLCYAIGVGDRKKILEYAADTGNIAMKIAEVFGEL